MKKTVLSALLALIVLCLGACGVPEEPPVQSTTETTTEATEQTTTASSPVSQTEETTSLPTYTAQSETTETEATTAETEPEVPVVTDTPASVLSDMCNEYSELSIAYSTIGQGEVGAFLLDTATLLMCANNFYDDSQWEAVTLIPDIPELMPRLFTVTVSSPDGAKTLEVSFIRPASCVEYTSGETVLCWRSEGEGEFDCFAKMMRRAYYAVEFNQLDYSIDGSYSPEAACELFVKEVYPEARQGLCEGNYNRFDGYELISWDFNGKNGDGTVFAGGMSYAYVPEDWESPFLLVGNTQVGTGDYEHMLVESRGFQMSLGEDGNWHLDDMGTGGYFIGE